MRIQEVYESNRANLYHSTTLDNAIEILKQGKIIPKVSRYGDGSPAEEKTISLTRDRNYIFVNDILFTISQEKLSRSHKMKPINYTQVAKDTFGFQTKSGIDRYEAEERVYQPIPINYIERITANADKYNEEDFADEDNYDWNKSMLDQFGPDAIILDKTSKIKQLSLMAKELQIPFHLQKLNRSIPFYKS